MKKGDLVYFSEVKAKPDDYINSPRFWSDEDDQRIQPGTKGMIISSEIIECPPGDFDPLNEFPYTVFTVLLEDGVMTRGWAEGALVKLPEVK